MLDPSRLELKSVLLTTVTGGGRNALYLFIPFLNIHCAEKMVGEYCQCIMFKIVEFPPWSGSNFVLQA